MTFREISVALDKINRRNHNNYSMQAALHGAKNVNLIPSASRVDVNRSEANNELVEQAMRHAQERKRREMAARGK